MSEFQEQRAVPVVADEIRRLELLCRGGHEPRSRRPGSRTAAGGVRPGPRTSGEREARSLQRTLLPSGGANRVIGQCRQEREGRGEHHQIEDVGIGWGEVW